MHVLYTIALLSVVATSGYVFVTTWLSTELIGRIVLVLLAWFLLSLPAAIFVGRVMSLEKRRAAPRDELRISALTRSDRLAA